VLTGVRQDAYARANPLQIELSKSGDESGRYLNPELHSQPPERRIGHWPLAQPDSKP
jgi:hypothetical protein